MRVGDFYWVCTWYFWMCWWDDLWLFIIEHFCFFPVTSRQMPFIWFQRVRKALFALAL